MTQFEQSNENLSFDFVQFFALIIEVKRQASGVIISVITLCWGYKLIKLIINIVRK